MPGAIAMGSVFVVVGIEMFFATRGAGHMHGSEYDTVPMDQDAPIPMTNGHANGKGKKTARYNDEEEGDDLQPSELQPNSSSRQGYGNVPTHSPHMHDDDEPESPRGSVTSLDGLDMDLSPQVSPTAPTSGLKRNHRPSHSRHESGYLTRSAHEIPSDPAAAAALEKKLLLQCFLLEAGILFHSVFIGIAVSVSVGPPFVVLLIAISFHQTFEGLALGSRIAAIPTLAPTNPKPWLMALAYGTTTPIGQAIGLGVHNLYDPQSQMGLLMVGTMNAISSGLLLFAGLVELLAADMLSDESYKQLKGRRRKEACGAIVAGAFLMALVGGWA
jgi:zinc transporter 1/2/3